MNFSFTFNGITCFVKIELGSCYIYFAHPETLDIVVYEILNFNAEIIAQSVTPQFIVYSLTGLGKQTIEALPIESITGELLRKYRSDPNTTIQKYEYTVSGAEFQAFFNAYTIIIKQLFNGLVGSLPIWGHEASPSNRASIDIFEPTGTVIYPVECRFIKTDETAAFADDGIITATIENAQNGLEYQISIDNGLTFTVAPLENGKPTLSFLDLAPNSYYLIAKGTFANKESVKQAIEIQPFEVVV